MGFEMKSLKASAASLLAATSLAVSLAAPVLSQTITCPANSTFLQGNQCVCDQGFRPDANARMCVASNGLIGGMSTGAAAAVVAGVVVLGVLVSGGGSGTTTN